MKTKALLIALLLGVLCASCGFDPSWKFNKNESDIINKIAVNGGKDTVFIFRNNSQYISAAYNDSIVIAGFCIQEITPIGSYLKVGSLGSYDLYSYKGKHLQCCITNVSIYANTNYYIIEEKDSKGKSFRIFDANLKSIFVFHPIRRIIGIKDDIVLYECDNWLYVVNLRGAGEDFCEKKGNLEFLDTDVTTVLCTRDYGFIVKKTLYARDNNGELVVMVDNIIGDVEVTPSSITYKRYEYTTNNRYIKKCMYIPKFKKEYAIK